MRGLPEAGRWADFFPEIILFVDGTGTVLDMNRAARQQLAAFGIVAGRTALPSLCAEPREKLMDYLRACARTSMFLPGAMTFAAAGIPPLPLRAEGAAFSPAGAGGAATLLLRLVPQETAASQFLVLNQKIEALSREIENRRRVESALEAEHRRKDEFLAMLGHELRNPLAPIKAAIELLTRCEPDQARLAHVLAVMDRQVDHLTVLVNELLDVARISTGKIRLECEPVGMAEVVRRAVELCEPLFAEKTQELAAAYPAEPLHVEGDMQRLTQAVANLLNNASKYTQERGRISVAVSRRMDSAEVVVRDNGSGIPLDMLPEIFDLFSQSARTLARSEGGLGVGLTLTRRLIELHGGRITAASEGPGRGSEFRIELPLTARLPGTGDTHIAAGAAGLRILVVDDNTDAAETLVELLHAMGNAVRVAADGRTALALAGEERPHVVFLDIGLPGMDGYTVARRLRAQPETSGALLVALTGYGRLDDARQAREAGFDHHLAKPARIDTILEILGRVPGRTSG